MDKCIQAEMASFKGKQTTDYFRLDTRLAVNAIKDLRKSDLRETTDSYCLVYGKYMEYIGAVNKDGRIEYVVPLPRGAGETPAFTGGLEEYEHFHKEYSASVRRERVFRAVALLVLLVFSIIWFMIVVKG